VSRDLEAAKKAAHAAHPIGHMGEADDIAWGVVYLASNVSRFVTGAAMAIDGGCTAR
jgi:NAD(P)-dependent dehydrogenase (short-subunit alcohol dehydrogenase family)